MPLIAASPLPGSGSIEIRIIDTPIRNSALMSLEVHITTACLLPTLGMIQPVSAPSHFML